MSWINPKTNWTGVDGVRDTDLNRMEGNSQYLYDDLGALKQHVDDTLYAISQRVSLSDLPIGAEFALYENGKLVPFLKVSSNYGNTGRNLVVRKSSYMVSPLQEGSINYYDGSLIDTWLNDEYVSTLDEATYAVLNSVNVSVSTFSGVSNILRRVFLLSKTEYGFAGSPVEGTALEYFSSAGRKIANLDGAAYAHWTRSVLFTSNVANYVTATGVLGANDPLTFVAGVRPAFTLPGTFSVIVSVPSAAYILADAEVI